MAEIQKVPTGKFHPGYGCAIFAIMILTFSGIVTWVVYSLLRQDKEIATFTVEEAPALPANKPSDAEKTALRAKLAAFNDAATKGEAVQLALTVADCNVLLPLATDSGIGGDKDSAPYPDLLRVAGFDAAARLVKLELRLPMNKLPWAKGQRFLVGSATFKPDIENGAFVLHTDSITVPGKTVSEGFVRNLRNWDWLDLAKKRNTNIADTMKRITAWHIAEDGNSIVLECSKAVAPSTKP